MQCYIGIAVEIISIIMLDSWYIHNILIGIRCIASKMHLIAMYFN